MEDSPKLKIILALLAVYLIWGSTYLAVRIGLTGFPPFLLAGIRPLLAGLGLYIFLRMNGAPLPDKAQWLGGALVGTFLIAGGGGGVTFAQQWVSSGLAALGVATTPLWTVLFSSIWKRHPSRLETAGLGLGFIGMALLNLEGEMRANPASAAALLIAVISWSFGSAWSRRLKLPSGMMAVAVEMISGGLVLSGVSCILGEKMDTLPSLPSIAALLYLMFFGSLIGFSAYVYLLGKVRPALATSYAYVNPVIAVLLGVFFAGEHITTMGVAAMLVILSGVALIAMGHSR